MRGNFRRASDAVLTTAFQFTPLHERQHSPEWHPQRNPDFNSRLYMRGNSRTPQRATTSRSDFNSRLYMRGNNSTVTVTIQQQIFQFMPLHERQRFCCIFRIRPNIISIHASAWEATRSGLFSGPVFFYFNSCLYMRGNGCSVYNLQNVAQYFNSCLYMRGNCILRHRPPPEHISIHASTWEATLIFPCTCRKPVIFQFMPLHERQLNHNVIHSRMITISIHASTWEATSGRDLEPVHKAISIHASTWEATLCSMALVSDATNFNSCLYMRGNVAMCHKTATQLYFNSCLYMRGNAVRSGKLRSSFNFNSCLYMRGNIRRGSYPQITTKFQFMPLHERQPDMVSIRIARNYFNSCLYMRGNRVRVVLPDFSLKFQFMPLHERQRWKLKKQKRRKYFNSCLYMRGNIYLKMWKKQQKPISIHASTWEATQNLRETRQQYAISIHASTWEATARSQC